MIRYKECQRNHAAHMGSHVLDGCGEFMAAGDDGTPEALKCAACECHRNFHRREADDETITSAPLLPPPPTTANCFISFNTTGHKPSQKIPALRQSIAPRPPVMVAFGGGAAAESSSEDLNGYRAMVTEDGRYGLSKKRFRTKFTTDQKEKMTEFADRIGWRVQKQNEMEVRRFCDEVGIKRQVFRVWLHNNKQAMKRKQL